MTKSKIKTKKRGCSNGKKVVIKKSTDPKKKYMAIFYENNKKIKTTHFGCARMMIIQNTKIQQENKDI